MTSVFVLLGAIVLALAVIGGTVFYFWREKNRQRLEDETRFRRSLLQALKKRGISSLRLDELIEEHEVSRELAANVAQSLYATFCDKVLEDAVVTEAERRQLDALQKALAIPPQTAATIESRKKDDRYRVAAMNALADGVITADEAEELQGIRKRLGLSSERANQVVGSRARDGYLALFREVAADGRITNEELQELKRYREGLGLSKQEANAIIREEAAALYRLWFHNVIQDGEVTEDEERALCWLRDEFGLARETESYEGRLREVKQLALYRKGQLPVVTTRKILEGGETCHWHGRCTFQWQTATQTKEASGDLVVTSQQIVFSSAIRSFSVSPSKIIDIRTYSDALTIQTSSHRGTGEYFVEVPQELEAILIGLARHYKYQLSNQCSSTLSRHIPDAVRREVWHRDRGRCVRCEATDYLEFDHIIPHTKGGASTMQNVQILCRRCNNWKSDRI